MKRIQRFVVMFSLLCLAGYLVYHFFPGRPQYFLALKEEDEEGNEEANEARFVQERLRYEFDMLKDPVTGQIPEGIFERERALARTLPVKGNTTIVDNGTARTLVANSYIPAGPNNIGGRTRAVAYDRRFNGGSNQIILAGCVSGGIMRSTDGGNSWIRVSPQEDIHNVTALVQDPRPDFADTWYAGSGEFLGNTASQIGAPYLGFGLWKSVNNGASWTKLPVTISNLGGTNNPIVFDHPFDFTYNLAINPVNGDLYVGAWVVVLKSSDGGTTFRGVFQTTTGSASSGTGQTHVEVSNTGRVYLAVNGAASAERRGVWFSETGELNTFTRIAGGSTLGVDSVAGWRGNSFNGASKRIMLRLAPSNNNIGYVYYENGLSSDPPALQPEADLFRFEASGSSFIWSNRSENMPDFPGGNLSGSDPIALQGGYNMELAIKPDDPNTVFVGGTNLYRSTDGFATNATTAWVGGYQTNFTYGQYPQSHSDIHRLVFSPINSSRAICANDGGVQETQNIMAGTVEWRMLPNYQTLQCYNVAIDPGTGRNNFASGSQDNGVRFRDATGVLATPASDTNNHRLLFSADGAYVGISLDDNGTQYIYESVQFGQLFRARLASPFTGGVRITPANLTTSSTTGGNDEFGEFVTNFRLTTEATDVLYYVNFNRLFRTTSASTVTSSGWTEMTGVSSAVNSTNPTSGRNIAIRGLGFSRGPYNISQALYIGTTNGKIFRLDDPRNAAATTAPADITPLGLTGNVQDIAVNPNDDNEVLAVVSNYNVTSVWWTKNGKSASPTWQSAEGNLSLPSFRSCAIVVKKDGAGQPVTEYYVGTSIGLYSTVNLGTVLDAAQAPVWQREGGNLLNFAVVTSLAYRPADNVMLVGTHGNGMYYTNVGTPNFTPGVSTGITPVTNDRNFIRLVAPTYSNSAINYQIGNLTGISKISVRLFNMSGQEIRREERGYQSGSVPVQQLASGVYILYIQSNDNRYRHVQKIVRQ
jgi:hypothetical protein